MLQNFQTTSILMGLFLRKLDVQDYRNFMESLPWRLPEFDAEPQLNQQLPPNAPPEAARVRFHSKDGRLAMEVAPAKIHFRMMPGEAKRTEKGVNVQALPVDKAFEVFTAQAMRIHGIMSEHFGATASRIGVVTDMMAGLPSSANQRIQTHVLSSKNLFGERLQDININALAKTTINGEVNVNRRIGLRPLRTGAEGKPDLLLNVNVDINTLAEEPYDLTTSELEKFLLGISTHIQTQVPLLQETAIFE